MALDLSTLVVQLNAESSALQRFIDLLRAEQAALVRGETDQVAAYVEPKSQHMFELTRLENDRKRLLTGAGVAADRAGRERLLHNNAGNVRALNAWRQFLQLATSAQQLNTTNGLLISTRLQSTQRALGALFSTARLPGAYGADGGTVSLRTAQQLAVA